MTPFGFRDPHGGDAPPGDKHFEVKDRRRVDRTTGAVREPAPADAATGGPSNPGGAGSTAPSATATGAPGSDDLAAARQEAAERTADLQRITAEYANYRKRVDRDKQVATANGKASVVGELLGILDDLDAAEAHDDLTGGFKAVADKLTATLQRLGLSRFASAGDEFDPNVHEAVQHATSPDVDHPTVTIVLRAGYHLGERLLRPAVVVVTGPEHEPADGVAREESPRPAGADSAAGDATQAADPLDPAAPDTSAAGPGADQASGIWN